MSATTVTPGRVLNAEWIKFRTLRSSWYALAAAVAALVAGGLIVGYTTSVADWSTLEPDIQAVSAPLQGFFLAQLIVGVLGVLFVTGEYGTGMIRSTFAAVPRRLGVVGAKVAVFGAVALASMTLASLGAFLGGQLFLAGDGHGTPLTDPDAIRAIAGSGLYLTLVGILGGALGWIIRSTAGAVAALVGIVLVLPTIVLVLGASVSSAIGPYLPSNAGQAVISTIRGDDSLAPWTGLGVFALWVAAAVAIAVVVVRRRDA